MDAIPTAEFNGFRTRFVALPIAVDASLWCHSIRQVRFSISVLLHVI